ncbi:uncharacterized protein LOC143201380 [Rhynchophorus ferrugineus]|uniref:uncharacterized protein LOC143201380 n=1 Tax=Rhynchophorus ferrugineus TaxID=354439 RepID=UPI003FCCA2E6
MPYNGEDLLNVFKDLNIDIRELNPNVIKAWFDTDCKNTLNLLQWMCYSLSNVNYVSPLEKAEYDELEKHYNDEECNAQLTQIDYNYLDIFEPKQNETEISLIEDEIRFLEDDSKTLDTLLKSYENLNNSLSTELTLKTKEEIQSVVECKKAQQDCVGLCNKLDDTVRKIQKRFLVYDCDEHFVNFVDKKQYEENLEHFCSFLISQMQIDKTFLEITDDAFTDSLEICKKRIIHSYQIYFGNKIEIETCKEIENFLDNVDIGKIKSRVSNSLNEITIIETKERYKIGLYTALDNMILNLADSHLKQTTIRYALNELEEYEEKSQNISNMYENLLKFFSYYVLTNCLQQEDKKDIEYISSFYQQLLKYVNEDLFYCQQRTDYMRNIIKSYASDMNPKKNLLSFIASTFNTDDNIQDIYSCVEKFNNELNRLECQIYSIDIKSDMDKLKPLHDDLNILNKFLRSGPSERIVVVPVELREIWLEIEDHIKKESASIKQAVDLSQKTKCNKRQTSLKQLWMSFLINPTKVKTILQLAEQEFKKRTDEYF